MKINFGFNERYKLLNTSKQENLAAGILSFDFELFMGGRFPSPFYSKILNVLEIEERNIKIISRAENRLLIQRSFCIILAADLWSRFEGSI